MEPFLELLGSQGLETVGGGWQLALLTILPLSHLEVENPGVVFGETLIMGYDSEKQVLVQGQASNGCEKPAVTCRQA